MAIIDADTHVDETEATWEHMLPEEQALKPTTQYPSKPDPSLPPTRYWLIDGKRQLRFIRDDRKTQTTVETRELLDVEARLRDMDRLGVDVHVLYPTLFLVEFAERPEVELALRRAYNRWLADRCAESKGRIRWVCLPPVQSMDKAMEELRFAKDHGAVGLLKKGDREAGKWSNDPYFFPLYEEAERLDLPVCFHTGSGTPDFSPAREFNFSRLIRIAMPVAHAFNSIIQNNLPQKFPKLRWGFIEAGASWVPYVIYSLKRQLQKRRELDKLGDLDSPFQRQEYETDGNLLKANNMWVACQVDEDLPYILKYTGEDNLLVGSDYTHGDPSDEIFFPKLLRQRAQAGEISETFVRKVMDDNPRAFYGL